MQKRSQRKSYCPGYYDLVTGGVMGPDDKDDYDNACRELMEELGIPEQLFMGASEINLDKLSTIKYQTDEDQFFCNIYLWNYKGDVADFVPQVEEVDHIEIWSFEKIKKEIADGNLNITGDSIACFKEMEKNF